jgi:uncharacterized protein YgiM (DUF1202 family)
MMRFLPIALLLLVACTAETPVTETTDTRTPIAVEYVRASTLKIHAKPNEASPVVTTWQHGESVSILARRGDWTEVRLADGSGWVRGSELAGAAEATKEADNTEPHFIRAPEPVTQPGVHGELVLEASVNTDGVVTSVRVLRNTTGSAAIEQRNIAELQRAVFRPMVRHGKREAFVYENRVQY